MILNGSGSANTLTGGAGDDTFNVQNGPNTMTGGGGNDTFNFNQLPYRPSEITDFHVGGDTLNLGPLMASYGYAGSDPVGDGYVSFQNMSAGEMVLFDPDGPANTQPYKYQVVLLDGVNTNPSYDALAHPSGSPDVPVISAGAQQTGGSTTRVQVNEFTLVDQPSGEPESGMFYVSAREGLKDLTANGVPVIHNGVFTPVSVMTAMGDRVDFTGFDPAKGQLAYQFDLLKYQYHPYTNGSADWFMPDTMTLQATDQLGQTGSGSVVATIQDAWPFPTDDLDIISQGAASSSGNVFAGVRDAPLPHSIGTGADDFPEGGALAKLDLLAGSETNAVTATDTTPDANGAFSLAGQYGTLTLQANGDYAYTVTDHNAPAEARDVFRYWVKDGDGRPLQDNARLFIQLGGTQGGSSGSDDVSYIYFQGTNGISHAEGDSGATPFSFTLRQGGPANQPVTINWTVTGTGNTPADGADFVGGQLPSGSVTFGIGETSKTITVNVAGDTVAEGNEQFTLGVSGMILSGGTPTGLIGNDDNAVVAGGGGTGGGGTGGGGTGGGSAGVSLSGGDSPQSLSGGAGNDTITAGHSNDTITTGAGKDLVAFKYVPWNASNVTDFTVGTDKADFAQLLASQNYHGADPVGDGYLGFVADGGGGTKVMLDKDETGAVRNVPITVTDLQHVNQTGLTYAALTGGGSTGGGGTGGQVITSSKEGDVLTGGPGADTLNAGQGPDTLTGGGGADHFAYPKLPWRAGEITDFAVGIDKIDLSALVSASGYHGGNLIGDGYLSLRDDGAGDTQVYFDPDGPASNPQWPFLITTVDHVGPASLSTGDFILG